MEPRLVALGTDALEPAATGRTRDRGVAPIADRELEAAAGVGGMEHRTGPRGKDGGRRACSSYPDATLMAASPGVGTGRATAGLRSGCGTTCTGRGRSAAAGTTASTAGHGSTSQVSASGVISWPSSRVASAEPASRCPSSSERNRPSNSGRSIAASESRTARTLLPWRAGSCRPCGSPEERDPARHPGPEVRADGPEDQHRAPGHVLAAVRADALHDRLRARVPDREAHPGATDDVEPPGGRAVETGVAGQRECRGAGAPPSRPAARPACRPRDPCPRHRSRRPSSVRSMPVPANAPKLWPAAP